MAVDACTLRSRSWTGTIKLTILGAVCGCGGLGTSFVKTPAEKSSGYTYIPVDPMAVETVAGNSCGNTSQPRRADLLDSLPDNAVRMSVESFDSSGNVKFGVGASTAEGSRYRVTTDFINADTVSVRLWINKTAELYDSDRKTGAGRFESVSVHSPLTTRYLLGSERFEVVRPSEKAVLDASSKNTYEEIWLPTYVGVGLRVTARVAALKGGADISGLGAIGAAAEAKYLAGDLVVQTLGINGAGITAALPIQSDLNQM